MKTNQISFLFLLFFFFFQNTLQSQTPSKEDYFYNKRFNAGIITGLNTSDIGNGWNVGIIGIADVTKHLHISIELLFSQNGDYIVPEFYPALDYTQVRFNYIEIPLQINYRIEKQDEFSHRKGWFRAGLSYAHLLNYNAYINDENVSNQILLGKENALIFNFGGAFFLNKNWEIDVKMSLPLTVNDLIPTFAFRGIYLL